MPYVTASKVLVSAAKVCRESPRSNDESSQRLRGCPREKTLQSRGLDGVPQDRLVQTGLQDIRKHQIHRTAEQFLQILQQVHLCIEAWDFELNEEVKVARRRGLAARRRPEQAKASHLKAPDFLTMVSQRLQNRPSGVPSAFFRRCNRFHELDSTKT